MIIAAYYIWRNYIRLLLRRQTCFPRTITNAFGRPFARRVIERKERSLQIQSVRCGHLDHVHHRMSMDKSFLLSLLLSLEQSQTATMPVFAK